MGSREKVDVRGKWEKVKARRAERRYFIAGVVVLQSECSNCLLIH